MFSQKLNKFFVQHNTVSSSNLLDIFQVNVNYFFMFFDQKFTEFGLLLDGGKDFLEDKSPICDFFNISNIFNEYQRISLSPIGLPGLPTCLISLFIFFIVATVLREIMHNYCFTLALIIAYQNQVFFFAIFYISSKNELFKKAESLMHLPFLLFAKLLNFKFLYFRLQR